MTVSAVQINSHKETVKTAYEFHHGHVTQKLKAILSGFDLKGLSGLATTASTPPILKVNRQYDNRISVMTAAKHFHNKVGSILIVGAEKFGLIRLDQNGHYLNFKSNTSCAAGTGSFIEEQAQKTRIPFIRFFQANRASEISHRQRSMYGIYGKGPQSLSQ